MQANEDRPPYVTFEYRAVEDREASIAAGHYVSKDVAIAFITPMGSKDRIERVATEWLESLSQMVAEGRFKQVWLDGYRSAFQAWKSGEEIPETGTSIRTWAAASPSQVKALLHANVRTVEDLSVANEETIGRIGMGARGLKQLAVEWLNDSQGTGKRAQEMAALKAENAILGERNKSLEERLAKLEARLTEKA